MRRKNVEALSALPKPVLEAWAENKGKGVSIEQATKKWRRVRRKFWLVVIFFLVVWWWIVHWPFYYALPIFVILLFIALFALEKKMDAEDYLDNLQRDANAARNAGFNLTDPSAQRRKEIADARLMGSKRIVLQADEELWAARTNRSFPHSHLAVVQAPLTEREKKFEELYELASRFELIEGSREDYTTWATRARQKES